MSLLSLIDEHCITDHYHLDEEDTCYYIGEYTARKGYGFSDTNQLILNFKKEVDRKGDYEYRYKTQAIQQIAKQLNNVLKPSMVSCIPVPPSKDKSDPLYDDRLVKVLESSQKLESSLDYCDMVQLKESYDPSHSSVQRLLPDQLVELYNVVIPNGYQPRQNIIIFDDVITTGSHFKAMKTLLSRQFPTHNIVGLFVARRVPETFDPIDDFIDADL